MYHTLATVVYGMVESTVARVKLYCSMYCTVCIILYVQTVLRRSWHDSNALSPARVQAVLPRRLMLCVVLIMNTVIQYVLWAQRVSRSTGRPTSEATVSMELCSVPRNPEF